MGLAALCFIARLWRARSVDVLAWVAAHSRASVLAGYGQAAAKLGLDYGGDADAVAARVMAWLGGTSADSTTKWVSPRSMPITCSVAGLLACGMELPG